jgi:hypothetical protein
MAFGFVVSVGYFVAFACTRACADTPSRAAIFDSESPAATLTVLEVGVVGRGVGDWVREATGVGMRDLG